MPASLSDFAKYVRPEVQECPELMVLDAILRAGIEFCEETKVIRQTITLSTVVDQAAYPLTVETGTMPEEVIWVKRDEFNDLTASSFVDFKEWSLDVNSGQPQYYYLEAGGILMLGNIPDAIETLQVTVRVRPTYEATTLPDELLARYKEKIANRAKAILMIMVNKPWTNPQAAALNQSLFDDAVNKANLRDAKGGAQRPLRTTVRTF